MDLDWGAPTSTWMSRRPAVTLTFDLQNLIRSSTGEQGITVIPCKFHPDCSSHSWDIVVTISVRTNERADGQTARKHVVGLCIYVYVCVWECRLFHYVCMFVFVCVLLSLHSLYQCTFRLYCISCAAFGVINDDDDSAIADIDGWRRHKNHNGTL